MLYALLFSFIAAMALLSVYKVAENQIEEQIDTRLKLETNLLLEKYRKRALRGLNEDINIYNKEGRPFYIYALINRSKLDMRQFIPAEQFPDTGQNQILATIPLSEIIDYIPKRKSDDKVRVLLTLLPGGYQLLVTALIRFSIRRAIKLPMRIESAKITEIAIKLALKS